MPVEEFFRSSHLRIEASLTKTIQSLCPDSRNNCCSLGETPPCACLEYLRQSVPTTHFDLVVAREEMRSDSDAGAHTIIDEDLPREQLLRDFVAVLHVDCNSPATPRRIAGCVDPIAALVG